MHRKTEAAAGLRAKTFFTACDTRKEDPSRTTLPLSGPKVFGEEHPVETYRSASRRRAGGPVRRTFKAVTTVTRVGVVTADLG